MDYLPNWKDLLTLATGIFGLIFSLIAYRRAKTAEERAARAEERAVRIEQQALIDAVVVQREQALAEVQTMKSLWGTRSALLRVYGASDHEFDRIKKSQMSVLDLCNSLVAFEVGYVRTHQDLVDFRLKWKPILLEMRNKEEAVSKSFDVLIDTLKAQVDKRTPTRDDA